MPVTVRPPRRWLSRFLHVEAASGILLLAATVVALVWANSPWQDGYTSFWSTEVHLSLGPLALDETLVGLVDDLLMAVFFFVVGMEVKRELVAGSLRDRRAATLPVAAALGGMAVPALVYAALNAGGPGASGWAIPMATDIAFALGVVSLLGRRVPATLKVLLLALAVVDDIGAIVVIAAFYADGVRPALVAAALALVVVAAVVGRRRPLGTVAFVGLGVVLWVLVFESGISGTIAGVALGLLVPARPDPAHPRAPSCHRWIPAVHPWSSYLVVPIFALANAGVVLSGDALSGGAAVFWGVAAGLVVGKLVGVGLGAALAVRLGLARLPPGVRAAHVAGVAAVAGIGFTVSLLITGLAFDDPRLQAQAKVGILAASVVAAVAGSAILAVAGRHPPHGDRAPGRAGG